MELAANYYRTRAHYADSLESQRFSGGREGEALCSSPNMPVIVFNKVAHEAHERRYSLTPKPIESLPLCKKCERAAKKLATAEGAERSDPKT